MKLGATATTAWFCLIKEIMHHGSIVRPRGKTTRELLNYSSCVTMRYPVTSHPLRDIGYKFMAAEAAWILSGDNRVSSIKPFAKAIERFSDDGVFFHGAYGPRIMDQLWYVAKVLANDPSSRQACLTIWRPNPPQTKDVPCTVAVQFLLRESEGSVGTLYLDCIDTMRSSDAWLGWPYDIFNFSMLSHYLALLLKYAHGMRVTPRNLYLNAGSQHIYEEQWEQCLAIIEGGVPVQRGTGMDCVPVDLINEPVENPGEDFYNPNHLVQALWYAARSPNGSESLVKNMTENWKRQATAARNFRNFNR